MEPLFGKVAKCYYDAGLPVIPLLYHDKRPVINGWQLFGSQLVDQETFSGWLKSYPHYNMGLVMGPQSGLVAVDIDTTDETIINSITSALPESDWVRIGQKGMVLLYKHSKTIRSKRIKDEHGNTIVEVLSTGTQIVLPPSIHPKTKKPYVANKDILDALPNLKPMPEDFEDRLRLALEPHVNLARKGGFTTTEYISKGGRDSAMTQMGGRMAMEVRIGSLTVKEAISMIEHWCENNTQKVVDDEIDNNKAVTNFFKFLISDVNIKGRILPTGWDEGITEDEKKQWGLVFGEERQEWEYDKIIEYLGEQFSDTVEGSAERRDAIDFVLRKIAKSTNIDTIAQSRILKYITKYSGDGVTESTYKKAIRIENQGPLEGLDHTEIARAVIEDYEERWGPLRYWRESFWNWVGDHWAEENKSKLLGYIASEYGSLQAAKKASDHKGVLQVMSTILDQHLSKSPKKGVNFINGFLTEDLKLEPHDPEQGMTYVMPYRYCPEKAGNFPLFNKLLEGYWSRDSDYQNKISALQESMCITIFGQGTKFQKAILLYGVGGSGKSQLLDVVSNLVPENARAAFKPQVWTENLVIKDLHSKLLNIAGELPEKKKIPGEAFKEMVSGDEVQGRGHYANYFKYRPSCIHWFASNYLPKSDDTSEGFFRRWMIFEFTREIPESEKILGYSDMIIAEEMEAIVSWAVQAYPRLKTMTSYTTPLSSLRLTNQMAYSNSSVRSFIASSEKLEIGGSDVVDADELYAVYFQYALKTGAKAESAKKFMAEIAMMASDKRGFDISLEGGKIRYKGVKIKK